MIKKIFRFLGNSLSAILKGEFLVRLGLARYFRQVLFVFLMIGAVIWASLSIDSTLNRVERNKKELRDLRTLETIKKFKLEQRQSREMTLKTLERMGSRLAPAQNPAVRLADAPDGRTDTE